MNRKAFTIIEMTIVIAVIAVLAAVLIPTFSGMIEKAYVSNDTQFGASLSVQLALWEVDNGNIENEDDLRNAVNTFYENGYYEDKLAPESGMYGYHFLYDIANRQVIVKKLSASDFSRAGAGSTPSVAFDLTNPRCITLSDGLVYFVMDCGESEVGKLLAKLREVKDNGEYADVIAELEALEDDAALGNAIATNLKTTALANSKGVFAMANTTVTSLYIPVYGGTELTTIGSSKVPASTTLAVTEIYLPTNTIVGGGSLIGFIREGDGEGEDPHDTMLEGTTVINVNATEAELVNGMVAKDSTNCVVELPTGERYAFIDGVFTKLGSGETWETKYSTKVVSFLLSDGNGDTERDYLDKTIYYSDDFSGDDTITLIASKFLDDNGDYVSRNVTWMQNDETLLVSSGTESELTVKASQIIGNGDITVTVQDVTYTITFQKVTITTFSFKQFNNQDIPGNQFESTGELNLDLAYSVSQKSWPLSFNIAGNAPSGCTVVPSQNITVDDTTYVDYVGGNLVLSSTFEAQTDAIEGHIVTLSCGDQTLQCKVKLTNANEKVFNVSNATYALNLYNDFTFTFGTAGADTTVTLGELFEVNSSLTTALSSSDSVKLSGVVVDSTLTGANWSTKVIDLSKLEGGNGAEFTLTCRGHKTTVTVNIVEGGYNVTSAANWKTASGNIVILNSFDIPTVDMAESCSANTSYSKNIGGNTIYGNLSRIGFGTYTIAYKYNNYFIYMTTGTIKDLIIDGPEYSVACAGQDASGYYVAGIEVAPGSGNTGTISNCFISGFRSPVRVDNNTCKFEHTTLYGGAVANVYVKAEGTTLVFDDAVTVQRPNSQGLIGVGFYLETDAKKVNVSGSLTQYNFICKSEMEGLYIAGTQITSNMIDKLWELNSGDCVHSISTTDDYVHAGFLIRTETALSAGSIASFSLDNAANYVKNAALKTGGLFGGTTAGYVYALDDDLCGSCANCKLTPDNEKTLDNDNDGLFDTADTTYDYLDFLSARMKGEMKE